MNKVRKRVGRLLSIAGVITSLLVWGIILVWRTETPQAFTPPVELLSIDNKEPVHIRIPELLPKGDYVLEVYSTVRAKDWIDGHTGEVLVGREHSLVEGVQELTTPKIVYKQGFTEWTQVNIPPILSRGAYTVVMHLSYELNPLKRVEQSALIAVLVVR